MPTLELLGCSWQAQWSCCWAQLVPKLLKGLDYPTATAAIIATAVAAATPAFAALASATCAVAQSRLRRDPRRVPTLVAGATSASQSHSAVVDASLASAAAATASTAMAEGSGRWQSAAPCRAGGPRLGP